MMPTARRALCRATLLLAALTAGSSFSTATTSVHAQGNPFRSSGPAVYQIGSVIVRFDPPVLKEDGKQHRVNFQAIEIGRYRPLTNKGLIDVTCQGVGSGLGSNYFLPNGTEIPRDSADRQTASAAFALWQSGTARKFACGKRVNAVRITNPPGDLYAFASSYYGKIPESGTRKGPFKSNDLLVAGRCIGVAKAVASGSSAISSKTRGEAAEWVRRWDFVRVGMQVQFGTKSTQDVIDAAAAYEARQPIANAPDALKTCAVSWWRQVERM